jgi:hypothetical protein
MLFGSSAIFRIRDDVEYLHTGLNGILGNG